MTNENNKIISKKMDDAHFCLAILASKGLSITSIKIADAKPVLTIDSGEHEPAGLKGGAAIRITESGRTWETYATIVEGCQVQWRVAA
jgi:hypothetical protein